MNQLVIVIPSEVEELSLLLVPGTSFKQFEMSRLRST
jgi:hypothetical protein